jgi:DNA-binding transcriptional ArsR family regulator
VLKQHTLPINIGSQTRKVTAKLGQVNVFSSDRKVSSTNFSSLVATFLQLANTRLSDTQKTVLILAHKLLKHNELTVTALADQVSRRSAVPYSTVKWNLRSLKEMGLLKGGDVCCKGEKANLTCEAQMLADFFEKKHKE